MSTEFIIANRRERERLHALVVHLTDEELMRPVGNHWTVAVALGHLAFWDERTLFLLRKWQREGQFAPSPIDIDVTNDALLALWRAIPPRAAANLALAAAEAVDREIEELPPDLIDAIAKHGENFRFDRSIHRKHHLDQIEAVITQTA
ncbi:MAG: maleylpyruvate isomerase N-terminal domain-containing protein [Desulfobacterales bacterium]|nr:maleylpyruvate isomerase N-terminal domain-containing protein [Desulfobacterales bacterium]